jgi:hypothetical protein
MNRFSYVFFLVGFIVFIISPMLYSQQDHHEAGHIMTVSDALIWNEAPPSLPPGAKIAVLQGDPAQEGPFTMRGKLPSNYIIPPHWHPAIEHVTVISGSVYMGLGERIDETKATKLPVGGFAVMEVGTTHFLFTKEEAIVQVHGIGPWGIHYVNPDDDPRKIGKAD